MLVVKPVLGLLLVAALGAMWLHRGPVVDAYRAQPTATAVQLSGIDLDHDLTEVGPSPFTLPVAADGRHRAPALTPVASSTGGGPVRLTGGSARLSGVVAGPEGPLAGATVRVERHTAAGRTSRDLTTGADGGWALTGLNGGRFRVRAWAPGGLTMTRSEVLYVVDGAGRNVNLTLAPVSPRVRAAFTTRGDIVLGLTATVAVSLTTEVVDDEGVVTVVPVVGGPVTLPSVAGFTVTPTTVATDGQGVARFTVRCHLVGTANATVDHAGWQGTVTLPSCVPPPPPGAPDPGPDGPAPSQQPIALTAPPVTPTPTPAPTAAPGAVNRGSVANARPGSGPSNGGD